MPITRGQSRLDFAYEGQLAFNSLHNGQVVGSNIAETVNVGTTAIPYGRVVSKVAGQVGQIRNVAPGDIVSNLVGVVPAMGVNERYTVIDANGIQQEVTGLRPRQNVAVLTNGIIWMVTESAITRGATSLLVRSALNTAGVNPFAGIGRITVSSDGLAGSTYITTTGGQIIALDTASAGSLVRVAVDFSYTSLLT
jgi:hypothetical protein